MASADDALPPTESRNESKDHTNSTVTPRDSNAVSGTAPLTTKVDENRPSDSTQLSSKKRRSDIQLNKDDHPEGSVCNSDEDDDLNDEGGKRSDPFVRASKDVIKTRKIVKVSSKWSSGGTGGASGGGTFATVKLAPPATGNPEKDSGPLAPNKTTSIFGSSAKNTFGSTVIGANNSSGFGSAAAKSGGFGAGFGTVSHGFGALKSSSSTNKNDSKNGDSASSKSTAFGGGFGAVSTGFGSLKSSNTSSGFGSTATTNATSSPEDTAMASSGSGLAGTFAKSPKKSSTNASPSKFPTSSVTANGEQDEDCICQVRAKLFRMVREDETPAFSEDSNVLKGDVPSVPSTSGRMELVKAKKEEAEESPEKANEWPAKTEKSTSGEDGKKPKLVRKEAGIGPVRVLKRKPLLILGEGEAAAKKPMPSRVVQRQETSGGQATKVILNIRLVPKTCNVIRPGDMFVQLNAPDSDGKLESSLFKVKTKADGDTLEKNLKAMLGES
eukprot:CAMPEP_0172553952 /NCGR_PEP_ID=MMETSP1067-20121228/52509_1 /TAXON_ID=265564 ORGANISM="Thalassiosira punctigera, Strain Tpunct2005C2" /NCGR_SAMPLE_ID=MMETSP1067 /ASSEMBLY_ACC=CAM_ASM_000444 /LENGTH=497 /DNA_ID=CAMNT_0013342231 /DNA_START=92 /DNA_END=1585 /DNA_ORIENTATION=+